MGLCRATPQGARIPAHQQGRITLFVPRRDTQCARPRSPPPAGLGAGLDTVLVARHQCRFSFPPHFYADDDDPQLCMCPLLSRPAARLASRDRGTEEGRPHSCGPRRCCTRAGTGQATRTAEQDAQGTALGAEREQEGDRRPRPPGSHEGVPGDDLRDRRRRGTAHARGAGGDTAPGGAAGRPQERSRLGVPRGPGKTGSSQ